MASAGEIVESDESVGDRDAIEPQERRRRRPALLARYLTQRPIDAAVAITAQMDLRTVEVERRDLDAAEEELPQSHVGVERRHRDEWLVALGVADLHVVDRDP